jgi:hypothetical protein
VADPAAAGDGDDDGAAADGDDDDGGEAELVEDAAAAAAEPSARGAYVSILERPKVIEPPHDNGPRQPCSRARSREARAIVQARLIDRARAHGVQLDRRCKFHPDNDLLRAHEANKTALASLQWKCKSCGKVFRSEAYIDAHFDRRHMDALPADATVCLADFCDVLGCASAALPTGAACSEPAQQRRRVLCQHLMHSCFPPERNADYWHVHERFERELCDRLTCGAGALRDVREDAGYALRIVGTCIACVVLAVLGCGIWCHQMDARLGPDLRRRSSRAKPAGGGMAGWAHRLGFGPRRTHLD